MVQVHSQDSRVGHAHAISSVLSAAQTLKIQKRKVPETKINPAVSGLSTNLNHSNLGQKVVANRTYSQLENPVRKAKAVANQSANLPSHRNTKQPQR